MVTMRCLLLTCLFIVVGSGCSNKTPENQQLPPLAKTQSSATMTTENALQTPSIAVQNLLESEPDSVRESNSASVFDFRSSVSLPTQSARSEDEIIVIKQQVASRVESLVKQFSEDADALEAKARFYLMLGDLEVARSCWARAIVVAPDYGYAHQGLGSIALRNSDYQLAVSHLTRAVEFMPDNSLAAHELSDAHLKSGDVGKAIEVLENALKAGTPRADTWQLLGQARIANRQYEAAGQAFEESLKLEPMNHLAKQGIGSVWVRMGKRDEARKWLEEQERARETKNLSTDQTLESERSQFATRLELVARVWLKHGRLNEALEVFRELTTLAPQNPSYWMTQGSLSMQLQQWKAADESFQKFIQLFPASPDGYAALAQTLIISGLDRERAVIAARHVTELRGSASDFATYSQSLAISGKIKDAIQAMQVAISKDPQSQNYKALLQQLLQAEETR